MQTDRKARINNLRQKLASLSKDQKQALIDRGIIATIEGRTLSVHNTILVYLQSNGTTPTVIGGYKQWLKAGKQVIKGQHGFTILFPVGDKDKDGNILDANTFFATTVFDVSQTQPIEESKPIPKPEVNPAKVATIAAIKEHQGECKPDTKENIMEGWTLV